MVQCDIASYRRSDIGHSYKRSGKSPEFDKYESLKRVLILCLTNLEEKQLRTLFSGLELGNKKRSQFLREMRSLAGDRVFEDLLRILWLQRLLSRTRKPFLIIDNMSLTKLAECANKIREYLATLEVHATESRPLLSSSTNDYFLKTNKAGCTTDFLGIASGTLSCIVTMVSQLLSWLKYMSPSTDTRK